MTIIHFLMHHWLALGIAALLCVGIVSNPVLALTLARKYWPVILAAVVGFALYEYGYRSANLSCQYAHAREISAQSEALAKAQQVAHDTERKLAAANQAAAAQYEKGRQDAQAAGKRVADDLRAGNIRLRQRWQGCSVPGAAPGAPVADDAASGRADSAGRIIAATHDDAEKIKALQELLRSERK